MCHRVFTNEVLSNEISADLIAESEVKERLDLGHSFLYKLLHPARGTIIVLNSSVGHSGVMQL